MQYDTVFETDYLLHSAHQLPSRLGRKALLYCWQLSENDILALSCSASTAGGARKTTFAVASRTHAEEETTTLFGRHTQTC